LGTSLSSGKTGKKPYSANHQEAKKQPKCKSLYKNITSTDLGSENVNYVVADKIHPSQNSVTEAIQMKTLALS
jgi:hypothetical protein